MTTIREAAVQQEQDHLKKYGDIWADKQFWVNGVIERKLGVSCDLVDYDDDNPVQLLLVRIDDEEFGTQYITVHKFSTESQHLYHVFDKYKWRNAKNKIRNSIELLRLLDD